MRQLSKVLHDCVQTTRWSSRDRNISSADFQAVYNAQRLDASSQYYVHSFRPTTPESSLAGLSSELRTLLAQYVRRDTDRFGNGLSYLMGGLFNMREPTVTEFAKTLIKPAALLGSDRVTELLCGWEQGEPLHYQACVLMEGVTVDRPLEIPGLRLTVLPLSSADLPTTLPVHRGVTIDGYLGGVVLCVDYSITPVFYAPPDEVSRCDQDDLFVTSSEAPLNLYYDTFCESLSLACNSYITWRSAWRDYGELQLFSDMLGGGEMYKEPRRPARHLVTQHDLEAAMRIYGIRHKPGTDKPSVNKRGLDLAIGRWIGSKRRRSHADRSIELRIALESLYLKDSGGEKRFRVAMYGAWHLGNSHSERRTLFEVLRQQYSNASQAIHGGRIRDKKYEATLAEAQDICRSGILQRLDEVEEPEWDDLVLGVN